jgi:glycosyltransferase involved in cell wall biosynthesis
VSEQLETVSAADGRKAPRTKLVVAHLTTVHPPDDPRIFWKQCRSLALAGHEVHLLACAAQDGVVESVHLHRVASRGAGRLARMTFAVLSMYRCARALDADVYHFHDPELIPAGLLLRLAGRPVIYDVHEHLPKQILTKPWIHPRFRPLVSRLVDAVERTAARRMSAVVAAAPMVGRRFASRGVQSVTVRNFPLTAELGNEAPDWSAKASAVCYVGAVTEIRGVREMIRGAALADVRLLLGGDFSPLGLEEQIASEPGWEHVTAYGRVSRSQVARIMAESMAGLVVLQPVPSYIEADPTKMYEYMLSGIPVIASDFPAWREVITRHDCGICVDPTDVEAIAAAIRWLLDHPGEARRMGENGRRAARALYSFGPEAERLIALYSRLAGHSA